MEHDEPMQEGFVLPGNDYYDAQKDAQDDNLYVYRRLDSQLSVSPDYMNAQTDINEKMRRMIIDRLIYLNFHTSIQFSPEVLMSAITLMDQFLSMHCISRTKFELVAYAALAIASKMEGDENPISPKLMARWSNGALLASAFQQIELILLATLKSAMVATVTRFLPPFQSQVMQGLAILTTLVLSSYQFKREHLAEAIVNVVEGLVLTRQVESRHVLELFTQEPALEGKEMLLTALPMFAQWQPSLELSACKQFILPIIR